MNTLAAPKIVTVRLTEHAAASLLELTDKHSRELYGLAVPVRAALMAALLLVPRDGTAG